MNGKDRLTKRLKTLEVDSIIMINIITDTFKKALLMVLNFILWPFRFILSLATKIISIIIAVIIIVLLTAAGIYYIGDITSFESLINTFFEILSNQLLG